METGSPAYFRKAIVVAFWVLPGLCAFYFVWRHCVAVPFWDEWNTPGAQLAAWYRGNFSFADLWSQHNESRKLVPQLIYLPLFLIAGWDVRLAIALLMTLVCLGSVGLYNLVRRTIRPAGTAAVAFGLMNVLLFSPRQYENFLYGIQWETFAPGFALVLAIIVNLSGRSLRWKTICNGTLALLSTFTFANGMLLWFLAFPLATDASHEAAASSGSRLFWRFCYILAAAASIGCYFISYQHPLLSPPRALLSTDAAGLLQFFLIWIGSLFRVAHPAAVGAVVLGLFLALAAISIGLTAKDGRWQSHYPWLVLGAYTLISGAATAVARLGFGLTMAADARYTVFTVMLYIAIVGLAFTIYEKLDDGSYLKRTVKLIGAVAGFIVVVLWVSTFTAERRVLKKFTEYRTHLQRVMRWADAIPENPELAWLSPYPETPRIIHTLGEHGALRPRLVGKDLARGVAEIPKAENATDGILEQAAPDGMGRLVVKGWARIPDQDRPADCVVVGWVKDDRWQPRWVLGIGDNGAGFSRALFAPNLPTDGVTVLAWGIDLRNERAFPLAGEIKISAAP
jgi:hypothetical protein